MEVDNTIYKKDTKGKIRELHVYSEDGMLYQVSGLVGGKLTVRGKLCKPKNVGRSNETTIAEQAILQATAKIKEKMKLGYFLTIKEAEENETILPMLAKSFGPEKDKIDWGNAYAQPKFDGQRCLAFIDMSDPAEQVILMSRLGTRIETMPHIIEQLSVLGIKDKVVLDGELYIHGHTFQENMRLIKKNRPGKSNKVCFNIYDMIDKRSFTDRFKRLYNLLNVNINNTPQIKITETHKINNQSELDICNQTWVNQGYEGSMVRWGDEGYKVNGRSSHLLKNKVFLDTVAEVMDILPNDADPTQGMPLLYWKGAEYKGIKDRIGCGVKGSHAFRKELLKNKDNHIGKTAELRFFEYSEKGVPRFPVFYGFRNDK